MTIFITGGSGFIGRNFLRMWFARAHEHIINLDKLSYAVGASDYFSQQYKSPQYSFFHGNINDKDLITQILVKYEPRIIINFAAESHVDRSILMPDQFIESNICGTFNLLKLSHSYWEGLPSSKREKFRFFQISTDEVYGSLKPEDPPSLETSPYETNSPYSASKASGDHLIIVNSTYGLPTLLSNCSNNYGPFQYHEKLIPMTIKRALSNKPIPIMATVSKFATGCMLKTTSAH